MVTASIILEVLENFVDRLVGREAHPRAAIGPVRGHAARAAVWLRGRVHVECVICYDVDVWGAATVVPQYNRGDSGVVARFHQILTQWRREWIVAVDRQHRNIMVAVSVPSTPRRLEGCRTRDWGIRYSCHVYQP